MPAASSGIAVFSDGERFPYLRGSDGLMSFWPTLFTTIKLRSAKKVANTISNELLAISYIGVWEQLEGRDLLKEFTEQRFLSNEDIESLRDHCYRHAVDLKKYMDRTKQRTGPSLDLIAPVNQAHLKSVQKHYAYNRMTVIRR